MVTSKSQLFDPLFWSALTKSTIFYDAAREKGDFAGEVNFEVFFFFSFFHLMYKSSFLTLKWLLIMYIWRAHFQKGLNALLVKIYLLVE